MPKDDEERGNKLERVRQQLNSALAKAGFGGKDEIQEGDPVAEEESPSAHKVIKSQQPIKELALYHDSSQVLLAAKAAAIAKSAVKRCELNLNPKP